MTSDFLFYFRFHEAAHIHSRWNMINTVLPVVFTSSFSMKTPNQTFEGICTGQPSEKRFAVRSGAENM